MKVQSEDVRAEYEKAKSDNIKLQDNLETQNKLWKMWLLKFENDGKPANTESNKPKIKEPNPRGEDEALLTEETVTIEDEKVTIEDAVDDDDEVTELLYQKYLKSFKESGFRRTTPAEKPEPVVDKRISCNKCTFKGKDNISLKDHMNTSHKQIEKEEKQNHNRLQFCHFWNNVGNCNYEQKNGRPCKFEHKAAPRCKFDGNCNRKFCMFVHKNQNMSFLANPQMNFQSPYQGNPWGEAHWSQVGSRRQMGAKPRQF